MKKHAILFPLSFLVYLILCCALPYVSARTWADIVALLSVMAFVYQIAYVLFFRKSLHISFGRAFASFFLWLTAIAEITVIYIYIDAFVNGYVWGFLMHGYGPYYGFEAWSKMGFESILYIPLIVISVVYQIIYFITSQKREKRVK